MNDLLQYQYLRKLFEQLELLNKELTALRNAIFKRLNDLIQSLIENEKKLQEIEPMPKLSLYIKTYDEKTNDLMLNLFFKCYLFIARQAVNKMFKVIHLLNPNRFPDGSKPKKLSKIIRKFFEDGKKAYEHDNEILKILDKHINLIYMIWLLRNAIKEEATFRTIIVNFSTVKFICSSTSIDQDNLKQVNKIECEYFKWVDMNSFNLSPEFIGNATKAIREINDLLFDKFEQIDKSNKSH